MASPLIITIDGPAGSGKSTVSKLLARRLGYRYLDTGALYRALAYKIMTLELPDQDDDALRQLTATTDIRLEAAGDGLRVLLDNEDVTEAIRTEAVGFAASTVSAKPVVRDGLLDLQRRAAARGGVVAEGRDMGTVVFPEAPMKFFLDASHGERTNRRYLDLLERGKSAALESVAEDLSRRDKQDRERDVAPLKPAEDAVLIDSTRLGIEAVVETMLETIRRRFPGVERPDCLESA